MHPTELPIVPRGLRADLMQFNDSRVPRRCTIVDPISGRISRLRNADWETLQAAADGHSLREMLLRQASSAGLLRTRNQTPSRQWWTFPLRLLAFQVRLFSIDGIANRLAKHSSFLLSPWAVLIWSFVASFASASLIVGWSRVMRSVELLYTSAGSHASIASSIAIIFVLTKCLHELGHAVACRRLQVPAGDVGLFFFLGMPCPYCDVSQIWRVDSRLQRAAVMLAGVYVELIIASIATLIWWLAPSGNLQLIAMNTIVVCGASAVLFNINPLMRLDGYFVLSDVLGTPNLRRSASLAWNSLVMTRIAGQLEGRVPMRLLTISLAGYHVASIANRLAIAGAISIFVMLLLGEWKLWWVGVSVVAFFVAVSMTQALGRLSMVLRGRGVWNASHWLRRFTVVLGFVLLVIGILCIPIRRNVNVAGWLDVQDAVTLYVPESSWVEKVLVEYGEQVKEGEELAKFRDDDLQVQLAGFKSRTAIAAIESEYLQRRALQGDASNIAWKLDEAARELVQSQFKSLENRSKRLTLIAPVDGIVLTVLRDDEAREPRVAILRDQENRFQQGQIEWCRIGDPTSRCVHLRLNRTERQSVALGDSVKLILCRDHARVVHASVDSIDEIQPNERPRPDRAQFIVKCRLAKDEDAETKYGPIGTSVEAKICIDREWVWSFLRRKTIEFVMSTGAGALAST